MPTLPEHLMIFPVFVKFTLLVFYVCSVRVKSCLFVLFLLFPIVSLCAISVLPYFWNFDVLDYLACCFGIRLPMFVQRFTIPGSNSYFNVSSIEKVVCWECYDCTNLPPKETTEIAPAYHQKQRQKVTTWRLFNFLNRCQLFAAGHTHTM